MLNLAGSLKVFLAPGATDMRKSFRGLSLSVAQVLRKDPRSGHVFAFCNRRKNLVKLLLWDGLGFWLVAKKLDQSKFHWPQFQEGQVELEIDLEALNWLLSGLDWQSLLSQAPERRRPEYSLQRRRLPVPGFLDQL